jgi:DNA-binding SARP family transcriptional activator
VGIRIALFGQPRVVSDDGSQEYALPRKTLNVLAYLILNRTRPPSRDTVAFTLFSEDDEETARNALRRNLFALIHALPDGRRFIDADGERLSWNESAPARVDVIAFEEALREERDADAIAEYAGQLLPTIYDEWATADRERLRDAYHAALSRTIAAQRSRREYDAATATAHRLLDDDPWREDIVRQLMAIRHEAGDRAGSLSAFERFAKLLRAEMHAEPMNETLALRDAVLRGARLATSEPRRAGSAATVALPFVGRERSLTRAHEVWQSAADGRALVLFVVGEAGVGKSRFATELVRLAEREGGFILRGYTAAGGEAAPYEAFAEALHETRSLFEGASNSALSDDRAARLRLFETVRRRLSELSRQRPVVLVLEDLHWAGSPTIELLGFVAQRLHDAPLLIVATARSDEIPSAHPLHSVRRQLRREGLAVETALDRLAPGDARSAARAALPETVDDALLERTMAWVDGVPLLLVEAVRDLAAGRTSTASSMTAIVAERFARLSPNAETALIFGAVVGERFDLGTLVAATGLRDDQVLDAIGESIEGGFVRAATRTPGLAFAFTHELVRVAAIERISPSDLTRAHGLVARAICAEAPDDRQRSREVARHFAAAGERRRAAEYFLQAAQYALDVFANEDARASAEAGLALSDADDPTQRSLRYELADMHERSLGRIGATEARRAAARLLVELADDDERRVLARSRLFEAHYTDAEGRRAALQLLADIAASSELGERTHALATARHAFLEAEYPSARESALRAASAFERAGDRRAAMQARCNAISCLTRMGRFSQGEAEIEALRPAVDASDDLVLRWEFHIVASSAQSETHRETALNDARHSLGFALRIGDRFAEGRSRHNVAVIAGKLRRYEEALDENERALAAYRDVGDKPGIRDVLLNIAAVRIFCGDYDRPSRLLDEVDEEATAWLAVRCALIRGVLATRTARFDDAERHLLDALQRAEKLDATFYCARCMVELAIGRAHQGRLAEALRYVDTALKLFATMGEPDVEVEAFALSARLRAPAGDVLAAREHAERAIARCRTRRPQAFSEIAANLAAAYAALGEETAAEALAGEAVAAAVDDAWRMPADLAETYLALPFHREALAALWAGRRTGAAGSHR